MHEPMRQHKRSLKQTIDWKLVICYLLLVLIGWVNIYASVQSEDPSSIFDLGVRSGKQFIWMLSAFGLAAAILFVLRPRLWEVISTPSYLLVLGLLVLVIFLSRDVKGSHSWFELGPVKFQPAEISKITTSLMIAATMSRPNFRLSKPKNLLLVGALTVLPMLVIIAESETGSALVYAGFIFVLYREGLSGWLLFVMGMCVLLFISTLSISPYASFVILTAVISLFYAIRKNRLGRWLVTEGLLMLALGFLPDIWAAICEALIPGAGILDLVDVSVQDAIIGDSKWAPLLRFKPIWVLYAMILTWIPVLLYRAYRSKHLALWSSLASLLLGVALIFSTEFLFNKVLQDHQRARIEVLLGLKEDPAGVGYNVKQSKIAIGSGGLFGKGFLNGTQTTYGFVPEQSTDFIFCTVGEEWGFAGCAVVILLYVFMISRIIIDAEKSREVFTRIYGYCVASCIFMHLFINIGMTIGLMPVIGIPLPLLSYGGSSLWAFTVLIFIFIALEREEKKYF